MEIISSVGRRKSAIARVYLSEGKGQIMINNRDYKDYFSGKHLHYIVEQPLNLLEVKDKYDIKNVTTERVEFYRQILKDKKKKVKAKAETVK